jgi:hypothetical protein
VLAHDPFAPFFAVRTGPTPLKSPARLVKRVRFAPSYPTKVLAHTKAPFEPFAPFFFMRFAPSYPMEVLAHSHAPSPTRSIEVLARTASAYEYDEPFKPFEPFAVEVLAQTSAPFVSPFAPIEVLVHARAPFAP